MKLETLKKLRKTNNKKTLDYILRSDWVRDRKIGLSGSDVVYISKALLETESFFMIGPGSGK